MKMKQLNQIQGDNMAEKKTPYMPKSPNEGVRSDVKPERYERPGSRPAPSPTPPKKKS